ncbi:hypothetical protein [Aliiroseovarius subalbicans]|uniref:hypothetical protein n=1 Tax=Aliiroseovarius subalbicans TaxID=2925840 RepID=UPI001F55C395|nr:hypothetical protein [Aliiroseovarius subalbicans]MCI2401143.1 hypothetical protein [Aliiroseovarius subalbicans]
MAENIRKQIQRGASPVAIILGCVLSIPAQADGLDMTFGLEQRLEADSNPGLDAGGSETEISASTQLSFGLVRETPLDRFSFTASGLVRAELSPDAELRFDDQKLGLGYAREGANSGFEIEAGYHRANIAYLQPLSDFLNDDGEIELPEDLEDLNGTGTRENLSLSTQLELGRDAPLGATFTARFLDRSYSGTTNPDLFDSQRTKLGTDIHLRLSPVAEGSLGLNYHLYDADDTEGTRRETTTTQVGIHYDVSPILQFEASLGYAIIDTEEFAITTRTEGMFGRLTAELERPNGTVTADLHSDITEDGTIHTFRIGRALDLPSGALAASIGVSKPEGGPSHLIGSLDWRHDLPTGKLNAQLLRSVGFDDDDGITTTTALALGYSHEINNVSGLNFDLNYAVIDDPTESRERGKFTAVYQRALTADWGLNAGYRYRTRDSDAESHAIFLSIGREFSGRP